MIRDELECITGKLIQGPITPVLFDLFKEAPNLDICIKALGGNYARDKKNNIATDNESNSRVSLEGWLAERGELIAIPGGIQPDTGTTRGEDVRLLQDTCPW